MNGDGNFHKWRPHPWHGLKVGPDPPQVVQAYIEITPFDLVKYEIDKTSGYTRVDRPQRSSSHPPTLYGFIPRIYCADGVAALAPAARSGDGDPLDTCVISERPINRSAVLLDARVISGLQMIDGGEADDKIVAVLANDNIWADVRDITALPPVLVERLRHYILTYKLTPGTAAAISIDEIYGRKHAYRVVQAAVADYAAAFGS